MLTQQDLECLWSIESACQHCIRAAHYFQTVSKSQLHAWTFTQNYYGAVAVVFWCQVFGSKKEPTHYSGLFKNAVPPWPSESDVALRLRTSVALDESQYDIFLQGVKRARDKFFVHNEYDATTKPVFPDLVLMVKTCEEMRQILLESVTSSASDDPEAYADITNWMSHFTTTVFRRQVATEAEQLEKAVMPIGNSAEPHAGGYLRPVAGLAPTA